MLGVGNEHRNRPSRTRLFSGAEGPSNSDTDAIFVAQRRARHENAGSELFVGGLLAPSSFGVAAADQFAIGAAADQRGNYATAV
jgi:hypothetical protein